MRIARSGQGTVSCYEPGSGRGPRVARFRSIAFVLWFGLALISIFARAEGKTVLDLQVCRVSDSVRLAGRPGGLAVLTNLNPYVNSWYVLELRKPDGGVDSYHLENAFPETQRLELARDGNGLVIVSDTARELCRLWSEGSGTTLSDARKAQRPYVELCDGRVYLRNLSTGRRTRKEWLADLLRDRVQYGEKITTFIKEKFFRDKYRQTGKRKPQGGVDERPDETRAPSRIRVKPVAGTFALTASELNFTLNAEPGGGLRPGRWYPVPDHPGVFVSAVTPELVPEETEWVRQGLLSPLDDKETSSLAYLVAFDLSHFDLAFALGTDHPRVGWSDRVPETAREPSLPGPDGFDNISPLVRTGKVNPHEVTRVAATFAGGFKRTHGAFKWGDLANLNRGSHYGFLESGVVLSTLMPGLATLIVYDDGCVEMKTWDETDLLSVEYIRYARQNGVPLLEPKDEGGLLRPGRFVRDWARGNWSGSESKQLRTLRAGACLQETGDGQFLIYGYFSSATPSAMARVFDACGCRYAMHLDMNAPEHTYLAIYRVEGSQFIVQRLIKEMAEVDPPADGQEVPRYIGYSDNRDFFYLLRKTGATEGR